MDLVDIMLNIMEVEMEEIITQELPQNKVPNPWRRYFARSIDMGLYTLLLRVFSLFVLRYDFRSGGIEALIVAVAVGILMVFIEPLLLTSLGTTPGKWLFGLVLRDQFGGKLSYGDGLERTFGLLLNGLGLQIPLYSFYRLLKSHTACRDNEVMPWDHKVVYKIKDEKVIRFTGVLVMFVLTFALNLFAYNQAQLPLHRGAIGHDEFTSNCQDFIKFHQLSLNGVLDDQGHWQPADSDDYLLTFMMKPIDQQVQEENGRIKRVTLETETRDDSLNIDLQNQLLMVYSSFVGADKQVKSSDLYAEEIISLFESPYKSFDITYKGYHIKNDVEMRGYSDIGRMLISRSNTDTYFRIKFVIERK